MPMLVRFSRKTCAANFYRRRFRDADFLDLLDFGLRAEGRVFRFAGFWAVERDFMIDRITDSTAAAAATLAAVFAALRTWALALVMKLFFFLAMCLSDTRSWLSEFLRRRIA